MAMRASIAGSLLLGVSSQQAGQVHPELHPPLPLQVCQKDLGCTSTESTSIVLDAGRRWLHDKRWVESSSADEFKNCGGFGSWNAELCPDPMTCAQNCALDGVSIEDYQENYGVSTMGSSLRINYVTKKTNVGSRLYLMDAENDDQYRIFKLKNREFTFDVDVSTLECGLNAALYFVEMSPTGGAGLGGNQAGAKYGTGYCDARCPHEEAFIAGEANMDRTYGSCCTEMDIFEGNKVDASMTAHPCSTQYQHKCSGTECGDGDKHEYYKGVCDKDGCEANPYRLGVHQFYGINQTVNTLKKITVVTQFITEDGTDTGALTKIRRLYVQNGQVIGEPESVLPSLQGHTINGAYCTQEKSAFIGTRDVSNMAGNYNQYDEKGGMGTMGDALERGMVLVLSLWDDPGTRMGWLDSTMPANLGPDVPGALRGPCKPEWGNVEWLRANMPQMYTEFSNLRFGDIGSTYMDPPAPAPAVETATYMVSDTMASDTSGYSYSYGSTANTADATGYSLSGPLRKAGEAVQRNSSTGTITLVLLAMISVTGASLVAHRRRLRRSMAASQDFRTLTSQFDTVLE